MTELATTLNEIARKTLSTDQPIPEGDLSEHLDSVERLALVVAIEDHFEIAFEPEDEEEVRTFQDMLTLVRTKLDQRNA